MNLKSAWVLNAQGKSTKKINISSLKYKKRKFLIIIMQTLFPESLSTDLMLHSFLGEHSSRYTSVSIDEDTVERVLILEPDQYKLKSQYCLLLRTRS